MQYNNFRVLAGNPGSIAETELGMKIKYSLIPFVPVAVIMVVFKLMGVVGLDNNGMFLGMNKIGVNYAAIGLAIGLFVLCVIINLFDRKTAPVYPVKKNPVAGIAAVASGLLVIASTVLALIDMSPASEYFLMMIICTVLSIPAGIALLLMSKVHFIGKSTVSGISMLFVFPSLWGCALLVMEFLSATKVSISSFDLTSLFCYIFLTLFLFSYAMVASRIKGRNPVKACYIYGLPAAALLLSYGVEKIVVSVVEGFQLSNVVSALLFIVLSALIVAFDVELFLNPITKDELEIIDGLPTENENYEKKYTDTEDYEELVFSERPDLESPNPEIDEEALKKRMASGEYDNLVFSDNPDDRPDPIPEHRELQPGEKRISGDDFNDLVFSEDYDREEAVSSGGKRRKVETLAEDEVHELVFSDDYDMTNGSRSRSSGKKRRTKNHANDIDEIAFSNSTGARRKEKIEAPGEDDFILGYAHGDYDDDRPRRGKKHKKIQRTPEDMLKDAERSEKNKKNPAVTGKAEAELAELFTRTENEKKHTDDVDRLLAELDNIDKQ